MLLRRRHSSLRLPLSLLESSPHSLGTRGVNLALASIQCFIVDSIAPESLDSKSAGCRAVTLGEIELFMF